MPLQLDLQARVDVRRLIAEAETDDDAILAVAARLGVDEADATKLVRQLGTGDPVRVTRARALADGQLMTAFAAASKSPQAYTFTRPPPKLVRLKGSLLPSIQRFLEWVTEQFAHGRVPAAWVRLMRELMAEQRQLEARRHAESELVEAREILRKMQEAVKAGERLKVQEKLGTKVIAETGH